MTGGGPDKLTPPLKTCIKGWMTPPNAPFKQNLFDVNGIQVGSVSLSVGKVHVSAILDG
jgi:hypothetical protein